MENFIVGVVGGVCGLSQFQYDTLYLDIRNYLRTAKTVTARFWHDPRNQTDGMWSDMNAMTRKLGSRVECSPVAFPGMIKDYEACPHLVPTLRSCDLVYLMPAVCTGARGRVVAVRRLLAPIAQRVRTVRPWTNETHADGLK